MSKWQQIQAERQAMFWELVCQGKSLTAACDAVGVERRQGYRWRTATGGRIPEIPRVVSGRSLSLEERLQIADLHLAGVGVRAIAAQLGRAVSNSEPGAEAQRPRTGSTRAREVLQVQKVVAHVQLTVGPGPSERRAPAAEARIQGRGVRTVRPGQADPVVLASQAHVPANDGWVLRWRMSPTSATTTGRVRSRSISARV